MRRALNDGDEVENLIVTIKDYRSVCQTLLPIGLIKHYLWLNQKI